MSFDALSGLRAALPRDGAPQQGRPVPPPIDGEPRRPQEHRDRGQGAAATPPPIDGEPRRPQGDTYRRGEDRPTPPPIDSGRREPDSHRPAPPPIDNGRRERDSHRPVPPPVSGDYDRPKPPPVHRDYDYDRPIPPPVHRDYDYDYDYDRPTPPPIYNDRPVPPPVHPDRYRGPRYFWTPSFPMILPTERQPLAQIPHPPQPTPGRKIDISEVSVDVYQLLGDAGRMRTRKYFLWIFPYHPKVSAGEAKNLLDAGKPVFVGPDSGWHWKSAYNQISSPNQLDSYLGEARSNKLRELQGAEDRAYQGRVSAWREQDVAKRLTQLPAFNSVYDTSRLMMANYLIWDGGRQFNRSLITAMNIYHQPSTRREMAEKWHANPNMSAAEFNLMANNVIGRKVSALYWDANWAGSDWGVYLGSNPVPGLRYPDLPEDVEWNANVIRRTATELPFLLNSAVISN